MIKYTCIQDIIKEAYTKEFGYKLFADESSLGDKLYKGKYEEDTELEKKLFDSLITYIEQNKIDRNLPYVLKTLQKFKEEYPDLLIPKTNLLYRSERRSAYWRNEYFYGSKNKKYYDFVYEPKRTFQSGTTNVAVAKNMRDYSGLQQNIHGEPVMVIFKAEIPYNELLFSPKLTNALSDFAEYGPEYEVIRLSKKPIRCKAMIGQTG